MASDTAILREYLVSLGFKIDGPGQKKFDVGLGKLDITAKGLTKSLVGVATAAQTMVGIFAVQMEKLYYSAKKADSTVGSMQALAFGAQNIGISGDQMKASLEGMARAMRSNPGLQGLLTSLGVEVKGRDKADVLMDFVTQLKKMPFAVAERYANMFGMDADTLFLMEEGLDKMKEAVAMRKQMAADAGLDMEAASEAAVQYSNALKETSARMSILYDMVSIRLLPSFMSFTTVVNENLAALAKWFGQYKTMGDAWDSLMHPSKAEPGGAQRKATGFVDFLTKPLYTGPQPAPSSSPGDFIGMKPKVGGAGSKQDFMAALEKKYALPAGLLDSLWAQESSRGKNLLSPAGAQGDFGFMPKTAKEFGVDTGSFESSAEGAAKKMSGLMSEYKGDLLNAVTAYNAGQGILNTALGGGRPLKPESANYGPEVLGRMGITQTNNITINGATDATKTGQEVAGAIRDANSDLTRNNLPKVR